MKLRKGILATLLSAVLVLACLVPAFAAESKTFEQTIEITQNISANPSKTSYTYRLYPNIEGTPLPEGAQNDEYYEFVLDGNDTKSIPVKFTVDGPVNYQYMLRRVENVPEGDTVTPEDHHFGYLFEVDADTGELKIIPYTCYDDQFEIWKEVDGDGNPTGVTLRNWIKGKETSSTTTNPSTTKKPSTSSTKASNNGSTATRTTYSSGNSSAFAKYVNTEDGSRIMFWSTILLIAALALIFLFFFKRRKDKDDEKEFES